MFRKQFAVLTLLLATGLADAQSSTSISVSTLNDAFDNAVVAAKLCFFPVDATGTATGFRVGNVRVGSTSICALSANGGVPRGFDGSRFIVGLADGNSNGIKVTGGVKPATSGGLQYASQFQTGGGNNGIANASAANQFVIADPSYSTAEQYTFSSMIPGVPSPFHLKDYRAGLQTDFFHNWGTTRNFGNVANDFSASYLACLLDRYPSATGGGSLIQGCSTTNFISSVPGWSFGNPPFGASGWRVNKGQSYSNTIYGSGIDETRSTVMQKYGVGDTIADYFYVNGEGGWTAPSDEGTKGFGLDVQEDNYRYQGTCTSGCTSGSTLIHTNVITPAQGTGRYLIDTTQGATSTTVTNLANGNGPSTAVTISGSVPVSNAWGTQSGNCGPANASALNTTPPFSSSYTCNITLTSGTFDTMHLVCFGSQGHECAIPTAVGTPSGGVQFITIPLRKAHAKGGWVYQGGMAGYGMELTSFTLTINGQTLRYPLDIVGSTASNVLQVQKYKQGVPEFITNFPGVSNLNFTGFWNISLLSNSGTTVSGVFISSGSTIPKPDQYNLGTWVIADASDSAFNTTCTNTVWTTNTAFTCTIAGLRGTHTAATAKASLGVNGANLWPMAEVIDVQNETLTPPRVDGTLALEPNVIAFAQGDTLEEPHHSASEFQGFTSYVFANNPFNVGQGAQIGLLGPAAQGGGGSTTSNGVLSLRVGQPDSKYLGGGGWKTPPNMVNFSGPYFEGLNFDHAPMNSQSAVLNLNPSSAQRTDVNYSYLLLAASNKSGSFSLAVAPNSGNISLSTNGGAFWSAASHKFVGAVALPSGSSINGKNLAGAGAGITTGPTNSTSGSVATFSGTDGQLADSRKSLAGAGAGVTTGPTSGTTAKHVATFAGTTGQIQDSGQVLPDAVLTATTASWNNSGSAIAANTCVKGPTVSMAGVATSMGINVTPVTNPGLGLIWNNAYLSSGSTVQVVVCNITADGITPAASTYNVRVIQ